MLLAELGLPGVAAKPRGDPAPLTVLYPIADVPHRHQPGTGEINYGNIYKKLAELNYDHYIAMEFMPEGDPIKILRAARQQAQHVALA